MTKWLSGGVVLAALAAGGFYYAATHPERAPLGPVATPAPAAAAADPAPLPPAVLAQVVDVTDIDPLLDPPAAAPAPRPVGAVPPVVTAVGYEEPAPTPRLLPPVLPVAPIPPATCEPDGDPSMSRVGPKLREMGLPTGIDWNAVRTPPRPSEFRHQWNAGLFLAPTFARWDDEFRPPAGPLLLDRDAVWLVRYEDWRRSGRGVTRHGFEWARVSPLAALVMVTDAELFEQRATASVLTSTTVAVPQPTSVWLATESGMPDTTGVAVRRAYSVFHAHNQAPASRAEWYTRWYGTDRTPEQTGQMLTARHIRDKYPPNGEARSTYFGEQLSGN